MVWVGDHRTAGRNARLMRRASLSSRLALEYPGVPPLLGVGDVQQRDKQGRELAQTWEQPEDTC